MPVDDKGHWKRDSSEYHGQISTDGSTEFPAEAGRYHLYCAYACPWAHRTLIARRIKGLEDCIGLSICHFTRGERGWLFDDSVEGCTADTVYGEKWLRDVYLRLDPSFPGRGSTPLLVDKKQNLIVNNESAEIIRIFNTAFQEFCKTPEQKDLDLYPELLRTEIDELNSWIYPKFNNGVYRAYFAKSQEGYDAAAKDVFEALDKIEGILSKKRYLTGDRVTEADVRLFTTLIRFDPVYACKYMCNKKRIVDCPNTWGYLRDLMQFPGMTTDVNFHHILHGYYRNPHTNLIIVPIGPELNYNEPHGREKMSSK